MRAFDGLLIPAALITACTSVTVVPTPDATSSGTTSTSNGGGGAGGGASTGGAGGGTSTGGAGGAPGVCVPGATIACYDGPAGTAGVGACKGGFQTCEADGLGYGPCLGQTLPQQDLCTTAADDDCSGSPAPCIEVPPWSLQLGCTDGCYLLDATVGSTGEVILAVAGGSYPLLGAGISAFAVARLDPSGKVIFAANLYTDVAPIRVAAEAGGTTLLASSVNKTLFIDRYDDQGQVTHFLKFPNIIGTAAALSTDAAGNILLAGTFNGTLDFGGGPLFPPDGNQDTFIAKLSPDGGVLWARRANAGNPMSPASMVMSLAIDSAQNVVVAGLFGDHADFGAGPLNGAGKSDIFLAKFDPAGNPLFTRRFGDADNQSEVRAALDPADDIFLLGSFSGTLDFGGGPLIAPAGGATRYLAKLDPSGNHVFSKSLAGGGTGARSAVAAGPDGSVFAAGSFTGTLDLGGAPLESAGGKDIYLARFDPLGNLIAAKRYGDASEQAAMRVLADPAGVPILFGEFSGTVDFGLGPITAAGFADIFISRNIFP